MMHSTNEGREVTTIWLCPRGWGITKEARAIRLRER